MRHGHGCESHLSFSRNASGTRAARHIVSCFRNFHILNLLRRSVIFPGEAEDDVVGRDPNVKITLVVKIDDLVKRYTGDPLHRNSVKAPQSPIVAKFGGIFSSRKNLRIPTR